MGPHEGGGLLRLGGVSDQVIAGFRRVATIEKGANFRRRYATRTLLPLPGLEESVGLFKLLCTGLSPLEQSSSF